MTELYSRRRAICIVAGAMLTGGAMLAGKAWANKPPRRFEWTGTAMGADARLVLYADDRSRAEAAINICVEEIERLENEFSLFRENSALCRLNASGRFDGPSHDMVRLLAAAQRLGRLTGGAFDVTVQPLWRLYADHFAAAPGTHAGPGRHAVARARALVDYRKLKVTPDRITLAPGQAVTLNGIAQGYVTDRVADLLDSQGWGHVLIDLGEARALGRRADGQPWNLRLGSAAGARLPLADRALAVSAGNGTAFDAGARHHHLFDPQTGLSAQTYRAVAVTAARAVTADALSTALYVMAPGGAPAVLGHFPKARAWALDGQGRIVRALG